MSACTHTLGAHLLISVLRMKDLSYLNKNASLSYEQFFLIVWFITEVGVNTLV